MRILLVEDEQKLAASLKKALESERYAVDVVHDGEKAFDQALFEPYDVIILDVGLPGISGLVVCRKLREEKRKTPILILTARDTITNKVEGLDSGADDYLVKPFDFEELLARIRSLIRRNTQKLEPLLIVDRLILNPATHIVKSNDEEIHLSAKEYALLEYLMRHPGQILSKTQILEHVWDMDTDPFSNVVDVYMGYLRNKIDKPYVHEKALIHTVKGLGYRIGGS